MMDRSALDTVPDTLPPLAAPIEHDLIREDGVFFGLAEDEYHGALALSASGIKSMRASTLDFWARSPLNPDIEDSDSEAKAIGRAYHRRILEGREAFDHHYAPAVDPADHAEALRTADDLKAELRARELPISGIKEKLIERLLDDEPAMRGRIWDCILADHRARHAGRELLPSDLIKRIEIAAAMIERHPQLCKAFTGGYPEVSVFWRDRESNVPCKARFDYLKPRAVVDLKTFENMMGAPVDRAVARAVAANKYHIQAAFYLEAANEARRLIAQGKVTGEAEQSFLNALVAAEERTFLFVFQQKGIAPLARGKILPPSITLDLGRMEIDQAKAAFARCWSAFGTDPWLDVSDISTFDPTEFPAFISD